MNMVLILAGGRGVRYGGEVPKQYTMVLGQTVLGYTLQAFQRAPEIDAIQVVCQGEYDQQVRDIARQAGVDKPLYLAPAGDSCPTSIRNGVMALRDVLSDDDVLLLHMSVSPLVSANDISQAVRVCREKGCCFMMHPVLICMACSGGDGFADKDAPKENYVEMNTPWAFRYGDVRDLYLRLEAEGKELTPRDYTLGLWLAEGRRAWYVPGDPPGRMKITTAHDRDVFEALLLRQAWLEGKGEKKP